MSKRAFKKYIKELSKEDLEEQIMDLYNRFEDVKTVTAEQLSISLKL